MAKQNRFIPGTGAKIIAPAPLAPDVESALCLSWNYQSALVRQHPEFMARGGRFIIPIPAPVLL